MQNQFSGEMVDANVKISGITKACCDRRLAAVDCDKNPEACKGPPKECMGQVINEEIEIGSVKCR